MSEIIQDYDEYTLSDFLPKNMDIINRGEMPEPLTLEIVNRVNWHTVIDVHGDSRDAKLVMKALVSYDANQALISKQSKMISDLLEINKELKTMWHIESRGCDDNDKVTSKRPSEKMKVALAEAEDIQNKFKAIKDSV